MRIEGATALVTGANRGLGKSFVEVLLARGAARIYAGARDPALVEPLDDRVVPIRLDVVQSDQVLAAAERCRDVDVLINNAGIMRGSPMLADDAEANFRDELEVNVFGTLAMIRAFHPALARNGGGAIANILSVASWVGFPRNGTYAASKHAALALTDAVRFQLKASGTKVVGVFSGYIDTDMAAGADLPKVSPRQVAEKTLAAIEEGRDQAYADEGTEDLYRAIRLDPEGFRAHVQQMWDDGAFPRSAGATAKA